jgi:hypothetical protein
MSQIIGKSNEIYWAPDVLQVPRPAEMFQRPTYICDVRKKIILIHPVTNLDLVCSDYHVTVCSGV